MKQDEIGQKRVFNIAERMAVGASVESAVDAGPTSSDGSGKPTTDRIVRLTVWAVTTLFSQSLTPC